MGNYLHNLRRRRRKRLAQQYPEMSDQRVAVIGLGRFGSSLALELTRRGWDVLGIDTDPQLVQRHSDTLTHSAVADCTDPEVHRHRQRQDPGSKSVRRKKLTPGRQGPAGGHGSGGRRSR
ncbi:NAD-binding protein [Streptomyces arboris]|uniref:NAD-binding protein n=1 Tax=Streptomyces arboris TaxID=2600619 RepID=UPI003C2F014C